jgi:glycosidase
VNPIYGSLDDIDLLVSKAHEKGLKVILDIALNHTSTEVRDFESQFKYRG